jgi:hypothetical protein
LAVKPAIRTSMISKVKGKARLVIGVNLASRSGQEERRGCHQPAPPRIHFHRIAVDIVHNDQGAGYSSPFCGARRRGPPVVLPVMQLILNAALGRQGEIERCSSLGVCAGP